MSNKDDSARRKFLKGVGALGLALTAGVPFVSVSATPASDSNADQVGAQLAENSQVFHVKVRGNLYESPVDVDVYPGQLSEPLRLKGKGTVRIKVAPEAIDPRFGPVYSLTVTDVEGKPLGSMNVGSNTTATFQNLGLQVYLLSVQQSSKG